MIATGFLILHQRLLVSNAQMAITMVLLVLNAYLICNIKTSIKSTLGPRLFSLKQTALYLPREDLLVQTLHLTQLYLALLSKI